MYYNIEFFFEKPIQFYMSEYETNNTVPQEEYELYASGDYIKDEDGKPKQIEKTVAPMFEPPDTAPEDEVIVTSGIYASPETVEILNAIVGLNNVVSAQAAEIAKLKGESS